LFRGGSQASKITGFKLDLDGHEIKLEQQTATGIQYDLNAQRFLRIMHASLSFDDFEKLVKSNSAKVHVGEGEGEVDFEINKNGRNALSDMLRVVQK